VFDFLNQGYAVAQSGYAAGGWATKLSAVSRQTVSETEFADR
jgi:hypothetical protein